MKKDGENKDKLSAKDLLDAMKEQNITAEQVATELSIILKDYYTGKPELNGDSVTIYFLNGQSFKLTVKKLK